MKTSLTKFALGVAAFALFVMTTHVFTHAFSSSPDSVAHYRFCQNLYEISSPTVPVVTPAPVLIAVAGPAGYLQLPVRYA